MAVHVSVKSWHLIGGLLLGLQHPIVAADSWPAGQEFRSTPLPEAKGSRAGFTQLKAETTGIQFTNELRGDALLTNAVAHNGAGVAIGDIDGDEWPDLYFCNLEGPNRLYRNLGAWQFEEVQLQEAACAGQLSTAAVWADIDGDGDRDLLVNGIGSGTRLFLNDGLGGLGEQRNSGLSRTASATSMALADVDGDGDLDLYCTHYIDVMHLADPTTRFAVAREDGQWRITKVNGESADQPYWKDRFELLPGGRVRELPESDGFYRNDGAGHFTLLTSDAGRFVDAEGQPLGPFRDWGLSVMFRDVNGDGAPDFYVCNDNASPDRLWLNRGDGRFREPDPLSFRHSSRSSMALDFADVDRDGQDDLLVLDMLARSPARRMRQLVRDMPDLNANDRAEEVPRYNRNMLFLGLPDGSFTETALMAGLAATDWSWCPAFLDVDLDGYEDLLVCNGFSFDVMDQDSTDRLRTMRLTFQQRKRFRQFHPSWPTANAAFRNRRDGTFEPASGEWSFDQVGISNGMALGDLDNDGDLDVVLNNFNDAASLYRNDAVGGRIAVRLRGLPPNTDGIGARLFLRGGAVVQSQEMTSGGRYLSCDQSLRVFAAPSQADHPFELEVRWRSGSRTTLRVQPNTLCEVLEPRDADAATATPASPRPEPCFADASSMLNHRHIENAFDDWAAQPLLPRRLSRLGPGLAWFDINDDGWEDLILSAAEGQQTTLFLNRQGQTFQRLDLDLAATGDQAGGVGWSDGIGHRRILLAQARPTAGEDSASLMELGWQSDPPPTETGLRLQNRYPLDDNTCPGPLALADIDGDGDLDLFQGGRYRPGRYPEPVGSSVWLNEKGTLTPSADLSKPFAAVGLVSGATFCDLDQDGTPDLALATDWGPVRIFRNTRGRFEDVTTAWGCAELTGWWTSVAAGDFDGDGRPDLVAGNWGRNSLYELDHPAALRLFYGETNGDGVLEIVEARQEDGQWFPVRPRPWLSRGFPDLPQRIPSHLAFGQATVQDILSTHFSAARAVEATCFESAVFLNRGTHFDSRPLPREAQLAPTFAVNTGDFDNDGVEDLFLSQNFFGGGWDLSREDGGRGQWLRGNGDGSFSAVDSGVVVLGEQRAAALADFDHDGRVDLVVSQNNGPTRLFKNQHPSRGLRVNLRGPPANPDGVGARIRLQYASGSLGPCRFIQAGSGYWSQDASTQVLGLSATPSALQVVWPGGQKQIVPLTENARDISVAFADAIR